MGDTSNKASAGNADPWVEHAKRVISGTYGHDVSLEAKDKDLLKYGRTKIAQTTETGIEHLPAGVLTEVFSTTNDITSIISTSGSDTTTVQVEGHTVVGTGVNSKFTFVIQEATLTGQTVALLTTPLARCTRVFANAAVDLIGVISVCEDDTYSSGVPQIPAGVHIQIYAGESQSTKASTTIEDNNYWLITQVRADCLEKVATFGVMHLEVRNAGKIFREQMIASCNDTHALIEEFKPYIIVPPNSDVRMTVTANSNGKDFTAFMEGPLLKVVTPE